MAEARCTHSDLTCARTYAAEFMQTSFYDCYIPVAKSWFWGVTGSWFIWSRAGCPVGAGFNSPPPSNRFGTAGDGAIMFIGGGPGHQE